MQQEYVLLLTIASIVSCGLRIFGFRLPGTPEDSRLPFSTR
jgi:hypothetical protein